ncbi:hypothetical protein H4Q26_010466 [Puccinia striiformis f. sp. tritici PST-130]|nr:hypothetical protein H4Q26_010466 [Puccinia striiformis f. sp. tritici PST-130]
MTKNPIRIVTPDPVPSAQKRTRPPASTDPHGHPPSPTLPVDREKHTNLRISHTQKLLPESGRYISTSIPLSSSSSVIRTSCILRVLWKRF